MNTILLTPEWLDTIEFPFDHKMIQLQTGTMHYVDEGEGDPVMFVHGTAVWSFLFRKYIRNFSDFYRSIAMGHIGFGLSENPEKFPV
jgi:pimeloyl-ACP methyl ester carboxylesterase